MRRFFVALILGCVVGFAGLAGTAEAKTIIGYASYYKHLEGFQKYLPPTMAEKQAK